MSRATIPPSEGLQVNLKWAGDPDDESLPCEIVRVYDGGSRIALESRSGSHIYNAQIWDWVLDGRSKYSINYLFDVKTGLRVSSPNAKRDSVDATTSLMYTLIPWLWGQHHLSLHFSGDGLCIECTNAMRGASIRFAPNVNFKLDGTESFVVYGYEFHSNDEGEREMVRDEPVRCGRDEVVERAMAAIGENDA